MCFLFFLPGSDLPKEDWLPGLYFDKWVHAGLFFVLVFLCRSAFHPKIKYYALILLLLALLYGFSVEIIQKEWIPQRDYDLYDVAADMAGSIAGLLFWLWIHKKNKPL